MGQVVLLTGEAGIGKSRLVQVLIEHVADAGHVWLECQGSPYYQHTALYPLIELLERAVLRFDLEESAPQKLHKLEGCVRHYGLQLAEVVPLLAALLSLPLPAAYAPLALSPEQQKQYTLHALLTLLLRMASQQPLLLVMEDLHWVDPSTLEWLNLLVDQGPTTRILALCTYRPDFSPPWTGRAHLTQMTLARLSQSQTTLLTHQVAYGKALPTEVVAQIAAQTDGVPLFVEEVTKMVLESGLLRESDERDKLTGALPPLAIPATLHDSLLARLDRLGTAKGLAQLGATIGRTFPYALLHAVASLDEPTLQTGLRHLVEAELLYQQGLAPQATFTFKHALIQEAAYQSLLTRTRQLYHQRIAQALEAQFPQFVATQPALLAHHAWHGAQWAMAARAFQEAGSQALARSAYREAVSCFDHALAACQHFPTPAYRAGGEQIITTLFGLRGALVQLGDLDRAFTVLHEAETLAQTLDDPQQLGRVSSYMARYCFLMGEHGIARAAGERALRLAQPHQDVGLQVTAQTYLGQVYYALGQYPHAVEVLERNRHLLTDDRRYAHFGMANLPVVTSLTFLTYCLAEQGSFAAGRQYATEGRQIAETAGHANSLAIACLGLGRLALNAGDLPQAMAVLEHGLHLCQSAQIGLLFSATAAGLGLAYALAGRVAEALPLLAEVQERGPLPSPLSALVQVWLSALAYHAGRLGAAQALAEEALTLAQTRQEEGHHAWALHVCGRLASHSDPTRAQAYYAQSRRVADALGMRPLQAHSHRGLGLLYAATGQREQAHAELSIAIDMYQAMEMTFWLPQTETALAQVDA
jgi:tetratricopeptide (TPR) repeat protein